MNEIVTCQGRSISKADLHWLRSTIQNHQDWSRHQISKTICRQWDWRTPNGQLKTIAARSLIDKLGQRGHIDLPPIRPHHRSRLRPPYPDGFTLPVGKVVSDKLTTLTPLSFQIPESFSYKNACFGYYLSHYHYLGFQKTVGQNLKMMVTDRFGRDLACLLFGSAAWQTAPRDQYIGWSAEARTRNLNFMTNNTRFLILPWVRVPNLASHLLSQVLRHLPEYWEAKYNHPVYLVETFVERQRFTGACYKAANWILIGQTKGRSRQGNHAQNVPVKDIFLYPLCRHFRLALCGGC